MQLPFGGLPQPEALAVLAARVLGAALAFAGVVMLRMSLKRRQA
jgi:hypothetical protein